VARGVAVFGSPGLEPDAATMRSLFGHHERLAEWLSKAGHDLTYDADCLAVVESSIDSWRDNTQISPMLANEVGTFLGTVVVRVAEGQCLNDVGFTIPAGGVTYWNGEAMHSTDYKDLDTTPETVASTTTSLAANAAHLATVLKASAYPPAG